MGLFSSVLGLTTLLTVAAFFITSSLAGSGFLLYVAMLGPAALWLLPAHVALALPFGLFGGALLAGAGARTSDRAQAKEVIVLTIALTCLSLYLVGWLMPAAAHATGTAVARYQGSTAAGQAEAGRPSTYELPRLLAGRADPEAGAELRRRLQPVAACLFLGLLAAGLVASPLTWRTRTAVIATVLLFILQVRRWLEAWSGQA